MSAAAARREGRAACWACAARLGRNRALGRAGKKGGGGKAGRGGKERSGPSPRQGGGEEIFFLFICPAFTQTF